MSSGNDFFHHERLPRVSNASPSCENAARPKASAPAAPGRSSRIRLHLIEVNKHVNEKYKGDDFWVSVISQSNYSQIHPVALSF